MSAYRMSLGIRSLKEFCFKDLTAASLADKVPERIECCIHVIRRMIGADLEADFLIALRHPNVILGALGRHH